VVDGQDKNRLHERPFAVLVTKSSQAVGAARIVCNVSKRNRARACLEATIYVVAQPPLTLCVAFPHNEKRLDLEAKNWEDTARKSLFPKDYYIEKELSEKQHCKSKCASFVTELSRIYI